MTKPQPETSRPGAARPPRFETVYATLPESLYASVAPSAAVEPLLLRLNARLAEELGLSVGWLESPEGLAFLAGQRAPAGVEPLAMAYAGHQFGHFVPRLGDGRAILIGEVRAADGQLRDLHLKGAGRTPFSRGGDGRSGIGPVLREYVVSEAMAVLGIPTTRALAMLSTGDFIQRPQGPEPGAMLVRVARGHIRVGTFEYAARLAASGEPNAALHRLVEHAYRRFVAPDAGEFASGAASPSGEGALASMGRELLRAVVRMQAELIARWLSVGFIHGVMNTDNCSIAGETLDYGPCAFMDAYHPSKVFSSIDHAGRYAYAQQPGIAAWNLARFAETLLPVLASSREAALETANSMLAEYQGIFENAYARTIRLKLGWLGEREGDLELGQELFDLMAEHAADFTCTFRQLSHAALESPDTVEPFLAQFEGAEGARAWLEHWNRRSLAEGDTVAARERRMCSVNPAYIPRNHRIEQAIEAWVARSDAEPLDRLIRVLARPFEESPEFAEYARPPEPHEVVQQTFCGT